MSREEDKETSVRVKKIVLPQANHKNQHVIPKTNLSGTMPKKFVGEIGELQTREDKLITRGR